MLTKNTEGLGKELNQWLEQEKKLSAMFSPESLKTRDFQLEKLKHFEQLASRYKGSITPNEKLLLKVLNIELRRLEKLLFPNLLISFIRRLFEDLKNTSSLFIRFAKDSFVSNPKHISPVFAERPAIKYKVEQAMEALHVKNPRTITKEQLESM